MVMNKWTTRRQAVYGEKNCRLWQYLLNNMRYYLILKRFFVLSLMACLLPL